MRQLFLTLLASLSLLLFIATIVLWLRSYHLTDHLSWRNAHGSRVIYTARGHLMLDLFFMDWSNYPDQYQPLIYRPDIALAPMNYIPALNFDAGDVDTTFEHAGFYWWERRNRIINRHLIIAGAPLWSIALATALLPLTRTTLRIRSHLAHRKLKRQGLCQTCAYDLRATPAGAPCPECGQISPRKNLTISSFRFRH